MTPLRLLLVDDDRVDRLAVKRLLAQAGIESVVTECADRDAALSAAHGASFDCVLLDYHLPGTDGLALLRDLRNGGVTLPVVALTGIGDEEVAVELMKGGAADYLNKNTLTPERLERSLRYAIALQRAEEERRQLLEREQQARLQAQAANRAKDEFLATLSHELRTPLNAILGWSRLLASGHLDEPTARRAVAIIERNTRLQAQLIEDLLDISRIVTGKLRLDFRTVDVRTIAEGAIEAVRTTAEGRGVVLECDLAAADELILCDPGRIQQVVWNLLRNAVRHARAEPGAVRLAARALGEHVELSIVDNGPGVPAAIQGQLFEPFFTTDSKGTGLGLYLARELCAANDARLEYVDDGPGAHFRIVCHGGAVA